jgi:hypothetical protein
LPEYSHIQTYVKCNQNNFKNILLRFIEMLGELGFDQHFLEDSFSELEWEVSDDGFIYAGCNADSQSIKYNDISLSIRPYVMGWTPQVISALTEPWLEICLLYVTEELILDYANFNLKEEVKKPIWDTMTLMSQYFNETGVFLQMKFLMDVLGKH